MWCPACGREMNPVGKCPQCKKSIPLSDGVFLPEAISALQSEKKKIEAKKETKLVRFHKKSRTCRKEKDPAVGRGRMNALKNAVRGWIDKFKKGKKHE